MPRHSLRLNIAGKRISESAIRHGIIISLTSSTMGMFWCCLVGFPLQMLLEALGASSGEVGALGTIMVLSAIAQIPGAFLSDRLQSRKTFWMIAALSQRLLWFIPASLPFLFPDNPKLTVTLLLIITGVSMVLGNSASAPWLSWMADFIPNRMKGSFWGSRQSWTMAGLLIASLLAGYLLDAWPNPGRAGGAWTGFVIVFTLYAGLGVMDILLHTLVPEPVPPRITAKENWVLRLISPLRAAPFRNLAISSGFWQFSLMFIAAFSGIILKRDFGATYSEIAYAVIAWTLGGILSGKAWGALISRVGGRSFGIIMTACTAIFYLSWFVASAERVSLPAVTESLPVIGWLVQSCLALLPGELSRVISEYTMPQVIWLFCLVNILNGMFVSGVMTCQFNLSAHLAPKEGRTMAMAVYWSMVGLIGSAGPWMGGMILDYLTDHPISYTFPWGTHFHPVHLLVAVTIFILFAFSIPFLIAARPPQGDMPVREAVSRIFVSNPVRAIHNIYTLGAHVPSWKRVSAIRSLGEDRTELAISDLIERLYDPSSDVREEAAEALGNIGTSEAVDALIAKLEDPHSDLSPQIARALRIPRSPKAVDILLRKLHHEEDDETRSQSARTLGYIGDRKAVPALLHLLATSGDIRTISSSSEALARLGELAAIHEILPRMKESCNPVLKRSLAVAVGDLLGEPEGFYQILSTEEESRGTEVEKMLKSIRAQIRSSSRKNLEVQGETLIAATKAIQTAYEEENFTACAEQIFSLGIGLSALRWGVEFGGDSKAFIKDLVWKDQRYGIGLGYLDFLRQGWEDADLGSLDYVDILLGIYFLKCRGLS